MLQSLKVTNYQLYELPTTNCQHANYRTTGADASVEVPKLHNIKLLIASFYDYNYHDEHL